MKNIPNSSDTNIVDITSEITRRKYVRIANSNETWQQIKASSALSGIQTDDTDADLAGRMLVGDITCKQALEELQRRHGLLNDV
jgi:hypothetical protein